jgi:membrane protein DedA with SNARE-associated domain
VTTVTVWIGQIPAPFAYAVLTAAVLAESVLIIGPFVPTLTLLLTAGAPAGTGDLQLIAVIAVAACAAVAGDALGHGIGRVLGPRLRTGRFGPRIPEAGWRHADKLVARLGGSAVLLSRCAPVVRTVTPYLVGAAGVPYRRIAPFSVIAGVVWASAEAVVGYAAAGSLRRVIEVAGPTVAIGCAVIVAGVLTTVVATAGVRRRSTVQPRRPITAEHGDVTADGVSRPIRH